MKTDFPSLARRARHDILSMSYRAKSAHTGGALSCVELLIALYFSVMRTDPEKPDDPSRDRLVFSKAHDAKALYAVLCARGYFPRELLSGYEMDNGVLPGHTVRHCVPGVEISAGALGHGLSMAAGMAYAMKLKASGNGNFLESQLAGRSRNTPSSRNGNIKAAVVSELGVRSAKISLPSAVGTQNAPRVFAILSDGECDEGSTWEAALFAGHHALGNLTVIIDYNKLQGYGYTKDVLNLEPFADKWKAFGFETKEIDGHSYDEILPVLSGYHTKPLAVIAHTIKGLGGPSQHINQISSQYKPPTEEEYVLLSSRPKSRDPFR